MKFLAIILFSTFALGQINESNKLPAFNPPSPKSFEFLKHGEIPVSKYNGLPNISVPLYTIKAKGIDIPINLSYHAGGFRVNEEAGWTGLGWSLSGGGSIVQIVNGYDDLGASYYRNRNMPDFVPIFDAMTVNCSMCPPGTAIYGNCASTLLQSDAKYNNENFFQAGIPGYYYIPVELFNGLKDYEPDVFKFNMLGYSGEFIIDWKDEKYVCLTDSKIKITPNTNLISGVPDMISILVPDGHKFLFKITEETIIKLNATQNEIYPSPIGGIDMTNTASSRSYQLISVVTNQGEQITYDYIMTNPIKNLPNISKSVVRYRNGSGSYPFPNNLSDNTTSYNYTEQPYSYINKIYYSGGEVVFTVSDRTDQVGSKKLDKIEIRKPGGNAVKTFNFNYDYFIGHSEGTNLDQYNNYDIGHVKTEAELTNRLKLLSVQEVGNNPYIFQYNSEPLPKKTSLATDYWGFYNGVLTNATPFVNIHAFGIEKTNPLFNAHDNNNKGSRLQHTKAGVLEKITYPTKGYTIFNYELNSFENGGSVKIPPFVTSTTKSAVVHSRGQDGMPVQTAVMFEEDENVATGSAYLSTYGCLDQNYSNNTTYVKIEVYKKEIIDFLKNQPNYNTYGLMYVLAMSGLLNGSNPTLHAQYIDDEFLIMKNGDLLDASFPLNYIFNKGVVVISSSGGCGVMGTTNNSQAYLTLSYKKYEPFEDIAQGGGLRVKDIVSYVNDVAEMKKSYTYYGGRRMSALNFYNVTQILNYDWIDYYGGPAGGSDDRHSSGVKIVLNSNSFVPISSSASGSNVGYDTVEERTINTKAYSLTTDLGKITEHYINNPDSGILPSMNYAGEREYKNGLVRIQEIYDNSNKLIQTTTNSYITDIYACSYGMKQNLTSIRKEYEQVPSGVQIFWYYHLYDVGTYPLQAYDIKLLKTVINEYNNDQVLASTTEYQYNDFNQQIYSKSTNSNNDIIESYTYHPKDLYGTRTDANQMYNSNVLSPVLRKEVKVNNELVKAEEFEYYFRFGNNNNIALPDIYSLSKYKFGKASNSPETRIIYNQYDGLGNPLDVSVPNGIRTSYIWGYNKQYVVAKIENVSYMDIPSNLLSAVISASDSSLIGTENSLILALSNLRSGLPQAFVTTYTYEPIIGIKIITDPTGSSVKYSYDTHGKLEKITDAQNNIINEYKYNFAQ